MAISFDDKLDPRRLRYFMQVVERGSVRGAAEALDMDASAVSRAIAQLEGDCGVSLLARHGRGIVVTEAGELLAVFARRLQNQKQQLLGQLDKIQKVALGHVDLVGGEGFVEWLTRNSLQRFMTDRPGITVDLDVAGTEEIVRRIVDERAHIGLVFRPPRDERLRLHGACPMPIVALVCESHPLARLGGHCSWWICCPILVARCMRALACASISMPPQSARGNACSRYLLPLPSVRWGILWQLAWAMP